VLAVTTMVFIVPVTGAFDPFETAVVPAGGVGVAEVPLVDVALVVPGEGGVVADGGGRGLVSVPPPVALVWATADKQ
jgi:hypothetical protein